MNGVLGLGMTAGLTAALWGVSVGGSLLLALCLYSAVGTMATLMAGLLVASQPEPEELAVIAD